MGCGQQNLSFGGCAAFELLRSLGHITRVIVS